MSNFDTQIHTEETSAYSDYVAAEELIALEEELELELDIECGVLIEDDEYDDFNSVDECNNQLDALSYVDQSYEYGEMQSQYDNDRDSDFYSS
jgi:hypothetical protein